MDETQVSQEQRLDGLDRCLGELPDQRQLIVEYYADAGGRTIDRRRELARRLGIPMNALGIRAWRIPTASWPVSMGVVPRHEN